MDLKKVHFVTLGALVFSPTVLIAQTEREHASHDHGVAELNIALESNRLYMEFESPSVNVVGFEHPPENDEQKQNIRQAIETLKNGEKVFIMPDGAQCKLVSSDARWVGDDEGHEEHDEEGHDDEHADHDEHAKGIHSEFHSMYEYACGNTSDLTEIDVRLFEFFGGIEELHARYALPGGQGATELEADSSKLELY